MKIALSGKMRSGKDTFSDTLKKDYDFEEFKFATGITEIIQKFYPEAVKGGKLREHYQKIGQALRQLDSNVWVNHTDSMIRSFENDFEGEDIPIVISDIRQKNEYKYAKANGYLVIKIEADEDIRIKRIIEAGDMWHMEALRHETEIAVDDIPADIVVTNNGSLHEFECAIEKIMLVVVSATLYGISIENYIDKFGNVFKDENNIRLEYL